uniref:RING-type domain-containing protein n=1 Tax=Oryza brachyantha TaxID=4533 RepID=J3L5S0_ORYBR
ATTVRDAGRTCAVCLNDLEPGASALVTPCGHAYHPRCITPWLEVNDTCPLCRAKSGLHAEDGGDAGSACDGLVLCELLDDGRWRYLLGRRVSGRIFAVRNLDQNGKLVRGSLLRR